MIFINSVDISTFLRISLWSGMFSDLDLMFVNYNPIIDKTKRIFLVESSFLNEL